MRVTIILCFIVVLLLFMQIPMAAHAQNGQSPNRQVTNSNTNTDRNSWIRFVVTTSMPFHFTPTLSNYYTVQLNSLVNGASPSCFFCPNPWWDQSVLLIQNFYSGSYGAWFYQALNEIWPDANPNDAKNFCYVLPTIDWNLNFTGYSANEQTAAWYDNGIQYWLTLTTNTGYVMYQINQSCTYPNGVGSINYFNQVEGVIVGPSGPGGVEFKPLYSTIFSSTVSMYSSYSQMSSSVLTTQTAEYSNLYQAVQYTSYGPNGNGWLYSVVSNENTQSS